ncbi:hypothetical protein CMI37_27170 [Candidatus Pacearchaeota archaeon]|nr:hypothetical protein [Candidatus Pacearchaeota archaeon]
MGFTVSKVLSDVQRIGLQRLRRTLKEGSPKYHWDVTALAAGASEGFDLNTQFPLSKKYSPLDTILVINNDGVDISVALNGAGGDLLIIPAGVIRQAGRDEIGAITRLLITNLDGAAAVTAGLIDIELWRSPEDVNSLARDQI